MVISAVHDLSVMVRCRCLNVGFQVLQRCRRHLYRIRKCGAGPRRYMYLCEGPGETSQRPLKCHLAPLIRKLSWCPIVQYLSETWIIPRLPESRAVKLSHFICLTLPAYFAAGTYCAGVFIIFTLLVTSCFGPLPGLHFSPFLRAADRLSGISFHRFLVPSARGWTHLTQLCAYAVQMSASKLGAWVPSIGSAENEHF